MSNLVIEGFQANENFISENAEHRNVFLQNGFVVGSCSIRRVFQKSV